MTVLASIGDVCSLIRRDLGTITCNHPYVWQTYLTNMRYTRTHLKGLPPKVECVCRMNVVRYQAIRESDSWHMVSYGGRVRRKDPSANTIYETSPVEP